MGKGAAIRSGIAEASGNFIAVQDADLEYDPQDLVRLIEPLIAGKADVQQECGSFQLIDAENVVLPLHRDI
jgi:glycosyltransferase involved in cell wall biosynthesis